jgi:hypothetical protein
MVKTEKKSCENCYYNVLKRFAGGFRFLSCIAGETGEDGTPQARPEYEGSRTCGEWAPKPRRS